MEKAEFEKRKTELSVQSKQLSDWNIELTNKDNRLNTFSQWVARRDADCRKRERIIRETEAKIGGNEDGRDKSNSGN